MCILTRENLGGILNKPVHGLSLDEEVDTLTGLSRADSIFFTRERHSVGKPAPDEVRAELHRPSDPRSRMASSDLLYYGLTPQGGAEWERSANADWSRYLAISSDERRHEVGCSSRSLLDTYMERARVFIEDDEAYDGSEDWTVLSPWNATYWKSLSQGHQVRFAIRMARAHEQFAAPPGWDEWWLPKWFDSPYRLSRGSGARGSSA